MWNLVVMRLIVVLAFLALATGLTCPYYLYNDFQGMDLDGSGCVSLMHTKGKNCYFSFAIQVKMQSVFCLGTGGPDITITTSKGRIILPKLYTPAHSYTTVIKLDPNEYISIVNEHRTCGILIYGDWKCTEDPKLPSSGCYTGDIDCKSAAHYFGDGICCPKGSYGPFQIWGSTGNWHCTCQYYPPYISPPMPPMTKPPRPVVVPISPPQLQDPAPTTIEPFNEPVPAHMDTTGWIWIAVGIVIVAGLAALAFYIVRRRRLQYSTVQ